MSVPNLVSIEEEKPSLPPKSKLNGNKRHTASGDVYNNSLESVFRTIELDNNPPVSLSRHATSSPLIPQIASPQSPSDSSSKGSRDERDLMEALSDMQSFAADAKSADSTTTDNIYDSIANAREASFEPPLLPEPRSRTSATESILSPPLPPLRPRGVSLLNSSTNGGGSIDETDNGDDDGAPPPLPKKSVQRVSSHEPSS